LSSTIDVTSVRTSAESTLALSVGSFVVAPGNAADVGVMPPTSPEVALAEADPAPLTLTERAAPVEPPVEPEVGVPDDPPWPSAVALPCRASATETAHWHGPEAMAGPPALEPVASCWTKDQIEFCIDSVACVWAAGKLGTTGSAAAAGEPGSGVEPDGSGLVDVTDRSVGADDAPVGPAEPASAAVVDESGEEGAVDVALTDEVSGALVSGAPDDVDEVDVVGVAPPSDGELSARATVAAQHNQHAASAITRTATRRR
jgi:hypothetical protein